MLIERNNLTPAAMLVIKNNLNPLVHVRRLSANKQFLTPSASLAMIQERNYFISTNGSHDYPEVLASMIDPSDVLKQTPREEFELAVKSLGGLLFYLKECLIDEEIVSLKLMEQYIPPSTDDANKSKEVSTLPSTVVLDACTLKNLDIFDSDIGVKGSLFALINYTRTKFGMRLLRFWISSPLTSISGIQSRQEAIEDLEYLLTTQPKIFSVLSKLPDMERLVNRIHTQGLKRRNDHPDSRAQMFDDYDKKKMAVLIKVMDGLFDIVQFYHSITPFIRDFKSLFLKNLLTLPTQGGSFPDIETLLTSFASAFDVQQARDTGEVFPRDDGSDPEYSTVCQAIRDIECEFKQVLKKECAFFKTTVKFVHPFRKRYLLEIPTAAFDSVKDKGLLLRYKFEGCVRKNKKFSTKELEDLVTRLKEQEDAKEQLLSDHKRRLFEKFSKNLQDWIKAIHQISILDCLLSMTQSKINLQAVTTVTKPIFISNDDALPFVEIREGKHPVLAKQSNFNFVANDVNISADQLILLTGPNMGGKSTLMRETGLIVIMAQMGCFVPASLVKLTPVDRIFTRLGSSDRILEGESTFFLEMSETASILRHASRHSLLLLDELGRGTSTFDGTAIAYSVVKGLVKNVKARTFFSTHYHTLIDDFENDSNVRMAHMDSVVQGKELVFMYRLVDGSCPKSHGLYAARMAGMPEVIIKEAEVVAEDLRMKMQRNKFIHKVLSSPNPSIEEARQVLKLLRLSWWSWIEIKLLETSVYSRVLWNYQHKLPEIPFH